jgi:hypothetical protein
MRVAIAALISIAAAAPAHADPWRGVELGGFAGFGTPLGTVGVELETIVYRTIAIAGGVGLGPGGSAAAIEPRWFQLPDGSGLYGGAGLSISGEHFQLDCGDSCIVDPLEDGTAYWVNVEAGYERHYGSGYVRGFVGFSAMLDKDSVCLSSTDCDDKVPYVGVAIGAVLGGVSAPATAPVLAPAPVEPARAADAHVQALTDEAREAAEHRRCDLVHAIDADVARLDRGYHDRVFVVDPEISACLE